MHERDKNEAENWLPDGLKLTMCGRLCLVHDQFGLKHDSGY